MGQAKLNAQVKIADELAVGNTHVILGLSLRIKVS